MSRIDLGALPVETRALARALIGVVLVRKTVEGITAGRIIETEAYVIGDAASHAFIGRRPRNASMFLPPLHAYVYQIYGAHFCFNVSSEIEHEGAAVLVRALEPTDGIDLMRERRGTFALRDLARGPGRLCAAMDIDRALDGVDLMRDGTLWLAGEPSLRGTLGTSRRIGITRAASRRLRFYERGNPLVSGPRALSP